MTSKNLLLTFLLPAAFACGGPLTDDPEATSSDAVYGGSTFDGSCNNAQESVILTSERMGRIVAGSNAFRSCLQSAVAGFTYVYPDGTPRQIGPYVRCDRDPGAATDSAAQTLSNLLQVSRSQNTIFQGCTPSGAPGVLASTTINYGLGHSNDEGFQWVGPVVTDLAAEAALPSCTGAATAGCRRFPYPYPFINAASVAWHEVAHTHGYDHGTGTEASCRMMPSGQWSGMAINTAPYIIAACMEVVAVDSTRANACGPSLQSPSCAAGQLSLVSNLGWNGCTCNDDPRLQSLGLADGSATTMGASGTFSVSRTTGNVLRREASGVWTAVGGPGRSFVANDDGLYAITPSGADVMRFTGTSWWRIGGASTRLLAGGLSLFSIAPNGDIFRWNGGINNWTRIGGPGAEFVVTEAGQLFALTTNRSAVMSFSNGVWTQIGGAAGTIFAAGRTLHALSPDGRTVLQFANNTWTPVVESLSPLTGTLLGGEGGRIYTLAGSRLLRHRGPRGRTAEVIAEDVVGATSYAGRLIIERRGRGIFELRRP